MLRPDIIMQNRAPNLRQVAQDTQNYSNNLLNQAVVKQGLEHKQAMNPLLQTQQKQSNQMDDLKIQETERAISQAEEDREIQSIIGGYKQARPHLEAGDFVGASQAIARRYDELIKSGKKPEELGDTLEALQIVGSRDPEQIGRMMRDMDSFVGRYEQGVGSQELKVGRFRELKLPDGSTATLDTATNQVTQVAKAPKVDLSVLPDDLRSEVKNLPRETQKKIVEKFASPAGQQKTKDAEEKAIKGQKITDRTKELVGELLSNPDAVRSVIGAFDESFFSPTVLDSSKDAEAALGDLKNLLTVENLGLMSGVLSESDIKIIESVGASGLSGSDERVIDSLQRMAKALGVEMPAKPQNVGRFKIRVK